MTTDPRIEAAAKAAFEHDFGYAPSLTLDMTRDEFKNTYLAGQAKALAAADAVMFSEEAVERVRGEIKHHLSPVIGWMALNAKNEDLAKHHAERFNERVEDAVRAVVAALRGDPS